MALAANPQPAASAAPAGDLSGLRPRLARQAQGYRDYFSSTDPAYRRVGDDRPRAQAKRYRQISHAPLVRDAAMLGRARTLGGYGTTEDATQKFALDQLKQTQATGEPPVPQHMAPDNGVAELSQYASARLGSGLTPEEYGIFRGAGLSSIDATQAEAHRNLANTAARSSYGDPTLGMVEGARADRAAAGQRADLETNLAGMDLQRKGELEGLATKAADLQEGQRQAIVGSEGQRYGQLSGLLTSGAEQGENRREYDMGFGEARRDRRQNMRFLKKTLKDAAPSTLEQVAAGLGGLNQGLASV